MVVSAWPTLGQADEPYLASVLTMPGQRTLNQHTQSEAQRVASRPPTVCAPFFGACGGTARRRRRRNDGTREGERIRRDWLSRPPRRQAFARVRIFDTSG